MRLTTVPLFASVRAGNPTDASDEKIDDIALESYLIDDPRDTIFVTVKGDSMIEAGIHEGDMLIVDKSKKARLGDIVIAVVDGEFTVKYLAQDDKKKFVLDPANSTYSRIIPEQELELCGVVTGSFRKY
jgi:SOS-response transcriptional repressor LexA